MKIVLLGRGFISFICLRNVGENVFEKVKCYIDSGYSDYCGYCLVNVCFISGLIGSIRLLL